MVQVSEAVQRSRTYVGEVFPALKDQSLQLEGVELSDDGQFWYVTFSYAESRLGGAIVPTFPAYKTIKVRAEDGQFYGARNGLSSAGLM
jgi:hypothetical protein